MDKDNIIKIINFLFILLTRILLLVKYENGFRFQPLLNHQILCYLLGLRLQNRGILMAISETKGLGIVL